jgi:hypothetical protein
VLGIGQEPVVGDTPTDEELHRFDEFMNQFGA